MSGYTPVFKSVFTGSLYGKFPDLPLWLVILAMADKNGEVDAHPAYISGASGIPVDQVEACITRFCEPDPHSRTQDDDGRRLIPMEGRGFGWIIVNHAAYREKARLMAKSAREVEEGKNAARMKDRRGPPGTAADPLSNANANSNAEGLRFSSSQSLPSILSEGVRGNGTVNKRAIRKAAVANIAAEVAKGMA